MKKRVLITTVISFLLLVAVIAAGLNAVFTVTLVQTDFLVCSAEGEREAASLKAELNKYVGSSTTFLDLEEVRGVVEAYPCMKVEKLEKKFPSTVEVSVRERRETFAVAAGDGYAVLAEDGTYLYDRDTLENRSEGENILLHGFPLSLSRGQIAEGIGELLSVYAVFAETLGEPRANIRSVSYRTEGSSGHSLVIGMREGIKIELFLPQGNADTMARAALRDSRYGYLVRSDGERLTGTITAVCSGENVAVNYDFSRV